MISVATARRKARTKAWSKCMAALGLDAKNHVLHKVFSTGFNSGQKYERDKYKVVADA